MEDAFSVHSMLIFHPRTTLSNGIQPTCRSSRSLYCHSFTTISSRAAVLRSVGKSLSRTRTTMIISAARPVAYKSDLKSVLLLRSPSTICLFTSTIDLSWRTKSLLLYVSIHLFRNAFAKLTMRCTQVIDNGSGMCKAGCKSPLPHGLH
jgi:hypothetical protein